MPIPIPPSVRLFTRNLLWNAVLPFHFVVSGAVLLNDTLVEITNVTGSSMAPTLSPSFKTDGSQDTVVFDKRKSSISCPRHNRERGLRRGDVVFFDAPHRVDAVAVKRIIALGGDTVLLDPRRRPKEVLDGRVCPEAKRWDVWNGKVKVPEGHVWVEGDNWRHTRDSNYYGPISGALIKGKAMVVVLPAERIGLKPWEGFVGKTRVIKGREED